MALIDKIQSIRTKNNVLWMDILRLAMLHATKEGKEIMASITENDAEITRLMKELAE